MTGARPSIGIIGPGRAGLGLALALRGAGLAVAGVHGRRRKSVPRGVRLSVGGMPPWLGEAGVVLLAVRDDALPGLVRALVRSGLARGCVFLHLSGALTSRVLAPLRARGAAVGAMHPLMTVSDEPRRAAAHLRGATFAIEGDAAAVRAARRLARAVAAVPVAIRPSGKARYHAGAVFASNYLVTMLATAQAQLVAAGLSEPAARRALAPLARASLANVADHGPLRALTGPVARGDVATLRRHLAALPDETRRLYAAVGRATLALARRAGLGPARAGAVERLLRQR